MGVTMKLASALFAAAASELTLAPLDLEWDNVAKGKKCSSSSISSTFSLTKVAEINVTFDMTKNTDKDLRGVRASLKIETKKKNKYVKCKPITTKQLKTAKKTPRDGDKMTLAMSCPVVEASEIRIDAKGSGCPEFDNIEVLTEQLICDDGYDGCVPLGPCHPGMSGGTIASLGDFNMTMNSYWNSTLYDCTYEYTLLQFTDGPASSWNLGIVLPDVGTIEGIWRAGDKMQQNAAYHTVYPMHFNPTGLHSDITFHITYNQECDSMDLAAASDLSFDYCSSDPIAPATTTVLASAAPTEAPTVPPLQLGAEVCHTANYDVTGSWVVPDEVHGDIRKRQVTIQFGNDGPFHNWRVNLKAANLIEMTSWNAEWDAAVATLTAKDYNQVLSTGSSLGVIFCTTNEVETGFSMEVCYQSEED